MTQQRDPQHRRRPGEYIQGQYGSMRALAIGAAAVLVLLLGYLILAPADSPKQTTAETGSPTTGNVPNPPKKPDAN